MSPISTSSPSFEQQWIGLNARDQEAARLLYERFIDQLIRLAARKLKYRLGSTADPESVAHSVFLSFFEGMKDQRFEARNWGMVFGLLAHITFRKCLKRKRAERSERRNPGGPILPLDDIAAAAAAPGPSEEAAVKELLDKAFDGFDAHEVAMVNDYLAGLTTDAVAQKVGLTVRTVQRTVERFRTRLERLLSEE